MSVIDLLTAKQRLPAEWEPHHATWTAWPCHRRLWKENLAGAQQAVRTMCQAIVSGGERLHLLAPVDADISLDVAEDRVERFRIPYGDIWLRDTGPVFTTNGQSRPIANAFHFNEWGGKFRLPYDTLVSRRMAAQANGGRANHAWILEGGSIDTDGEGTLLTTEQCLLNSNRNPQLNRDRIEELLTSAFNVERVLWITRGLLHDHTDGHVDNIARFVRPQVVACMVARTRNDPQAKALREIRSSLARFRNAKGRALELVELPSPGIVRSPEGDLMPASYLNFYIANGCVVVPTYASAFDEEALRILEALFPTRRVIGVDARALLTGGGAFHCITQQEPAWKETPP